MDYYKDYQELFANCAIYYDLSSCGISGTTVYNMAIPGTNNGTLVGSGWTYTDLDKFGIAKQSNAFRSGAYITTGYSFAVNTESYGIWFKVLSLSMPGGKLIGAAVSSNNAKSIMVDATNISYTIYNFGNSISTSIDITLLTGVWLFCGVTANATTKTIWLFNLNTLIGKSTTTTSYTYTGAVLPTIGVYNSNGSKIHPFNGNIGEIMIWNNRELSESDIYMLYNLTRQKYLYPVMSSIRGVE